MNGFIIAAPSSGSGKTTLTLGILRALTRRGEIVRGAKSGPDYIDPRFHEAACGRPCPNLDAWAMSPDRIRSLAAGTGTLIVEGAMGLFDGAPPDNKGATADLSRILGIPVVLVVDASRLAGSVAPIVSGFRDFAPDVPVVAVILNNVGSDRHEAMLRRALAAIDVPVLGALRRDASLVQPSRHLGLVQASERTDLEQFLDMAAERVSTQIDLEALLSVARPLSAGSAPRLDPPAQRIAIAQDAAFAFAYPHLIADWRVQSAEIAFFSPLADEAAPEADMIYLPGGYPELYAGKLAAATRFMQSLRNAAQDTVIYGECGGYMTLGQFLIDADGVPHEMAGLLGLETSFAKRKLHLGYRNLMATTGPFAGSWTAHEFHYATTISAVGTPLFTATDAEGTRLAPMGLIDGLVSGSFGHIIDRA
ncbi:MAG: cobyrinate a,c-diamide synthase [Rhodobacteraceae bacterium]|nr:cobyrinate a,c-diamide synthase [Paracoccaceae bacterium]